MPNGGERTVDVAVRQEVPSALTRPEPVGMLAALSETEFAERLRLLKLGQDRLRQIQREILVHKVDYDTIPGTQKPSLLKPGAEKLAQFYGIRAVYERQEAFGDGQTAPHIRVTTTCRLHVGSDEGPVVAEATAGCNSWERRYRYRRAEHACPSCGNVGAVIRSKYAPFGWVCLKAKGGCGRVFPPDTAELKQKVGDAENPDPYDGYNTILRISEKRALVAAVKMATASSGLFERDEAEVQDKAEEAVEVEADADAAEDANQKPARRSGRQSRESASDLASPPDVALLVDEARKKGMLPGLFEHWPSIRIGKATKQEIECAWNWMHE